MAETLRDLAEYQSDHDLLIVLNERVATLIVAVGTKNDDHENRIRWLERRGWMLTGASVAISTCLGYAIQILFR